MNEIPALLRLRLIVGYLGEKSQFGWWQSDFLSAAAAGFLGPILPRTQFLAQSEGAGAAACLVHDERIGVGRVFHLFRLPESLEEAFRIQLQQPDAINRLGSMIVSKDHALELLETEVGAVAEKTTGPVLVGEASSVMKPATIAAIGQTYLSGFKHGSPVFPYLKEEAE